MAGLDPSPQTTLLILLGASSWPYAELPSSTAFESAVRDLHTYFLSDPNGFHLPERNILDLFNSDELGPAILNRISVFLKERKESRVDIRDILVYFVGHGGIPSDSSTFYLAIHRTEKNYEKGTSITIGDLAERLKKGARFQRRILILDCCFSARALQFLQGSVELASRKTIAAFEEKDQSEGFPSRGMSFLASSGKDAASIILSNETSTMFTSALLSALRTGDPFQKRERLPLRTVHRLTIDFLHKTYGDNFPWPEIHSPDQIEGDVADIPFFPNPPVEEERRRQVEEVERSHKMEEERLRTVEEVRTRQIEDVKRIGKMKNVPGPLPPMPTAHTFLSANVPATGAETTPIPEIIDLMPKRSKAIVKLPMLEASAPATVPESPARPFTNKVSWRTLLPPLIVLIVITPVVGYSIFAFSLGFGLVDLILLSILIVVTLLAKSAYTWQRQLAREMEEAWRWADSPRSHLKEVPRQGNGTDLLGNHPLSASIGIIYVSPTDDRKSVLAAIITQKNFARKQVAIILPEGNKAFSRPVDFDVLKGIRHNFQAQIVFVAPAGPGPSEFARQRRFLVYSSMEYYARALRESGWSFGADTQKDSNSNSKK